MPNTTTTSESTDQMAQLRKLLVEVVGVPILANSWTANSKTDPSQLRKFAAEFRMLSEAMGKLSTKFNVTVWEGWDNGTIPTDVKGTRERRDPNAQAPGRKAAPKTPEQILFGS